MKLILIFLVSCIFLKTWAGYGTGGYMTLEVECTSPSSQCGQRGKRGVCRINSCWKGESASSHSNCDGAECMCCIQDQNYPTPYTPLEECTSPSSKCGQPGNRGVCRIGRCRSEESPYKHSNCGGANCMCCIPNQNGTGGYMTLEVECTSPSLQCGQRGKRGVCRINSCWKGEIAASHSNCDGADCMCCIEDQNYPRPYTPLEECTSPSSKCGQPGNRGVCRIGSCRSEESPYKHSNCGGANCMCCIPNQNENCHDVCPAYNDPVCGSDGKTYHNNCYLSKASCHNPDEDIVFHNKGSCDGGDPKVDMVTHLLKLARHQRTTLQEMVASLFAEMQVIKENLSSMREEKNMTLLQCTEENMAIKGNLSSMTEENMAIIRNLSSMIEENMAIKINLSSMIEENKDLKTKLEESNLIDAEVNFRTVGGTAKASSTYGWNKGGMYNPLRGFAQPGPHWHSSEGMPQSIWYEFPHALRVVKYSFQTGTSPVHGIRIDIGPSRYEFWGSNGDCSNSAARVTLLEDSSGKPFTKQNVPKVERVENPESYRCYGFTINETPLNSYAVISNIRFYYLSRPGEATRHG